jgi:prepilin signal peptidase PulO-like enzyme (type II secretory pathway)
MNIDPTFATVAAVLIALVAVAWDLKTRRIPNALTFGAALAAVLVHGYAGGAAGAGLSLGGWLVGAALYSSIAGGGMALAVAAFSGYLRQAFTNLRSLLIQWHVAGIRPVPDLTLASNRGPRLAYAVPVLTGLMVTVWLQ